MSTPRSTIYLCSGVPLNNRYDHTFYFQTPDEQTSYFTGKVARTLSNYTYLRKTWKLKVDATMDAARVWSYLFFRNGTGKTYYYFINQIEYLNDNTVELSLELDVLQTYMFDWVLRRCYVEREHSRTDEYGENTIDEGLDGGDMLTRKHTIIDLNTHLTIITASTLDLNEFLINDKEVLKNGCYGNVFSGFDLSAVALDNWDLYMGLIAKLNAEGKTDAIFTMWEYPTRLIVTDKGHFSDSDTYIRYVTDTKDIRQFADPHPTEIDGYTPKNKKVLQYPYCFMYITNNSGGAAVYQYEKFPPDKREFRVTGNVAPDGVVRLTPMNYKGVEENVDESLKMGNFPVCAWDNDTYKMWLAQNQNQQSLGMGMSGLKILAGAAAAVGGVIATVGSSGTATAVGVGAVSTGIGMITSGATDIASQLAQRADKEVQPPQARGSYAGSHNVSTGINNFEIHHKTIDRYHAEIIDNYFSMYGYATRRVKIPNISSRPYWNYVKTIGSNIGGDICMEDLQKINSIFDKGVTFWRTSDLGNYAADNSV